MTYYEDLNRCYYFDNLAPGVQFIAVGWLSHKYPFPTGVISKAAKSRLISFLKDPWDFSAFWGSHLCDICAPAGSELKSGAPLFLPLEFTQFPEIPDLGSSNLFIPDAESNNIYVVPSLIVHYIESHQYNPPIQFQDSLMKCPEMNSQNYFEAMRDRGLGERLED